VRRTCATATTVSGTIPRTRTKPPVRASWAACAEQGERLAPREPAVTING
jgi:hypothetical protein